jgi:succinate dehydrogenase / fumarate reductase cytochrome b subunit
LLFHAVYGLFIVDRAKLNYLNSPYKWSQNRMYTLQRLSGIFLFVFLIYHTIENTGMKYYNHDSSLVKFNAWHSQLTSHNYLWLVFYMAGVLTASYHLCYGLWSFCIRWGLTISDAAQMRIQRFSFLAFLALTVIGWGALAGFVIPRKKQSTEVPSIQAQAINFDQPNWVRQSPSNAV